jgi:dUTP pyrophosphatase
VSAPDNQVQVPVRRLDPELPLPAYAHHDDAGADLVSAVDVEIAPGERVVVPTGTAVALPEGYAGFVHPRSGLAARNGIGIVNAPGTIDAGYRGEIKVILINHGQTAFVVKRGERIAQMVIAPMVQAALVPVATLSATDRGAGGFGSTGR